jgi:hypothetical protein
MNDIRPIPVLETESLIHILRLGLPLCRFTTYLADAWPDGHKWVRFPDPCAEATCYSCNCELTKHSVEDHSEPVEARVTRLEARVTRLEQEIELLKTRLTSRGITLLTF